MKKRNFKMLRRILSFLLISSAIMSTSIAASEEPLKSVTEKLIETIDEIHDEILEQKNIIEEKKDIKIVRKEVSVCGISVTDTSTKSYESGNIQWDPSSSQFTLMNNMQPNAQGIYQTDDEYLGVALGSVYGSIGTRYEIVLSSGKTMKVIKADEKDDVDTINGCYHKSDGSMLEFIIDPMKAADFFGIFENGFILGGNFNNYYMYRGNIESMSKINI